MNLESLCNWAADMVNFILIVALAYWSSHSSSSWRCAGVELPVRESGRAIEVYMISAIMRGPIWRTKAKDGLCFTSISWYTISPNDLL